MSTPKGRKSSASTRRRRALQKFRFKQQRSTQSSFESRSFRRHCRWPGSAAASTTATTTSTTLSWTEAGLRKSGRSSRLLPAAPRTAATLSNRSKVISTRSATGAAAILKATTTGRGAATTGTSPETGGSTTEAGETASGAQTSATLTIITTITAEAAAETGTTITGRSIPSTGVFRTDAETTRVSRPETVSGPAVGEVFPDLLPSPCFFLLFFLS